jgi:hypothetical protein
VRAGRTRPRSMRAVIVDGLGSKVVEDIVVQREEKVGGEWSGYVFLEIRLSTRAEEGGHATCSLARHDLNNRLGT